MFMLEMRGTGHLTDGVKRAITSAVLQQFVTMVSGPDSSSYSAASVLPSVSASAEALLSSQCTAASHACVLLMVILGNLQSHIPQNLPPATIKAVGSIVRHCHSRSGLHALDACSNLELQFIMDTLVHQFSSKRSTGKDLQKVRLLDCVPYN